MSESVPDLSHAQWRTSSLTRPDSNNCVEVADLEGMVATRDSTDPDGPAFVFSHDEWAAFVASARRDDFA